VVLGFVAYYSMQVKFGVDLTGGVLLTSPLPKPVNVVDMKAGIESKFDLVGLDVRLTGGGTPGLYVVFSGEKSLLHAQQLLEAGSYQEAIDISKKFTGELNTTADLKMQADLYFSRAREGFKNDLVGYISAETGANKPEISIKDIGPSLGAFFLSQARSALIFSFIFIVALIFFFFRKPLISFAVMQSAFYDALLGYAALGFFNIPLSLATLAPILMLIGYSVDTDIMLTDRMLKRKEGTPAARAADALKTGLTMTFTAMGALTALFLVSHYAGIETLSNISLVLVVGLVGDIMCTWCTNAGLVLWYLERKQKKSEQK
jgi:preprotein translocase subunit SecF